MAQFAASYNTSEVIDMVYPNIRTLREDRDWSQEYVASQISVNRRTYSGYETGNRTLPPEVLIQLAALYQTSVDYLLGLTENPTPYR